MKVPTAGPSLDCKLMCLNFRFALPSKLLSVMTTQTDCIGYSSMCGQFCERYRTLLSIHLSRDWDEPRTKLQLGRHASGRSTELGSSLTWSKMIIKLALKLLGQNT